MVPLKLFAFLSKRPMVGNCVAPSRFRRQCAGPCRTAAAACGRVRDKGNMVSAGSGAATGLRLAASTRHSNAVLSWPDHLTSHTRPKMDRERELKIIRRAYAKQ